MSCFFMHKWGKWDEPALTNPVPEGKYKGDQSVVQVRKCERCGKCQRTVSW